ncbi:MAG: hypothetical protein ABSF26_02095 [Thermoguttaceae bacterium]
MERVLREITAGLGGEKGAETPLDRAQEVMYQAFEASGAEQVRLARKALEISPDCADAYVLLAEHARTVEEARKHYEQGVAAGERALGKQAFEEHAGEFWGFLETRPYMRAREGLAQCLSEAGRREEAAGHYQEMLRLNPNDNQGVRYCLATLLLDLDRDQDLRRLLAEYVNDPSAMWTYTKALFAFREGGESHPANKLLAQATKANKHVPAYLLGHKQLPTDLPPYVTRGGEDEAVSYAVGNRRAWLNAPGAISWLRKTLNVPLPEPPRRRRPSWPELKRNLLRLPQQRGEAWQVDAMPSHTFGEGQAAEGSHWTVAIISSASHELLCLDVLDAQPQPADVWDYLTDAMRQPRHAEPRRPARIEVRQKAFQAAWKAELKQIKVECDKFQSGPWYAVVMGQSGVQQGLAVYEDLAALQELMTGGRSEEENSRGMSALSLMFSEAFEIPVRDLDAVERHGWPVAGPEAYPLVIRINPGRAMRPPLVWELELLEGCLRAIPEFLAANGPLLVKTVAAASAKLMVRLSWVGEG